jgi:hypothetical protein
MLIAMKWNSVSSLPVLQTASSISYYSLTESKRPLAIEASKGFSTGHTSGEAY